MAEVLSPGIAHKPTGYYRVRCQKCLCLFRCHESEVRTRLIIFLVTTCPDCGASAGVDHMWDRETEQTPIRPALPTGGSGTAKPKEVQQ